MPIKNFDQRIVLLKSRLGRVESRLAEVRRIETRYPWIRLGAFLLFLTGSFLALRLATAPVGWGVTLLLLAVFVVTTIAHRQVLAALERYQALQALVNSQVARASLDWQHIPEHLPISVSPDHPFDRDLIITGPRSLHQLLDSTASKGGSERLAEWLLALEPELPGLQKRQQTVQEILSMPGLRARLALDGALMTFLPGQTGQDHSKIQRWDGSSVIRWLERSAASTSLKPILIVLGILAAANILLFTLNATGLLPAWWILTLLIYLLIQSFKFRESSEVFGEAYELSLLLSQLSIVLSDLETYPFQAGSQLAQLCTPFQQGNQRPSRLLRRASQIAAAASVRGNPFLSLILNLLVPWDLFFAYQLEQFKQNVRTVLPTWMDRWYTLEALCALAEFSALNPGYTFPQVGQSEKDAVKAQPVFQSAGLGHPLIPHAARVLNDFSINHMGTVILVTGSNMSGKSTFLRTIGANLCLAYAGSVVCADSLRVLPFRLFTSMNVADSLNDGISLFYAEVRRLKALLDELEEEKGPSQIPAQLPLFFLIDEIFRGTNNRERRIGSESYLRALTGKNGAGLISTHDLELVHLADENAEIRNFHFREEVIGERMVFDYRIRSGPSPTTNALRIMAIAGLPVQSTEG